MDTHIKNTFVDFSNNWESYLVDCKVIENGTTYYRNRKDHVSHNLLIDLLPRYFESLIDTKKYKIKSSLGEGNVAGIPWLCVMNMQITDSVTDGYYVAYLFSRNAKNVYLSIGIGATQFSRIYGETMNRCVPKIQEATQKFQNTFQIHAPYSHEDHMDLFDESDKDFIRQEFSQSPKFKAEAYQAGCFFTKKYNLMNDSLTEEQFIDDFNKYIKAYEAIINEPTSSDLIHTLGESVLEESDISQTENFDYQPPDFNPEIKEKVKKTYPPKSKSGNRKSYTKRGETKKVGNAGEKHVFDWEFHRLSKIGREDLAHKIVKQYDDYTFYPGYDIKSFDTEGNEIYIEVKSTQSKKNTSFEITANEVAAAEAFNEKYFIYTVVNALTNPTIEAIVKDPIKYIGQNKINLDPSIYTMEL